MTRYTITEALAELKTLKKRIEKKQEFIRQYLIRQDQFRDPHIKDGGSFNVISNERQSLQDLLNRFLAIRMAIADANRANSLTIADQTQTIAEWLVWKREVAPILVGQVRSMVQQIQYARAEAAKKGLGVVKAGEEAKPTDLVVNVDEKLLSEQAETLEVVLGDLDGKLSLANATIMVELA